MKRSPLTVTPPHNSLPSWYMQAYATPTIYLTLETLASNSFTLHHDYCVLNTNRKPGTRKPMLLLNLTMKFNVRVILALSGSLSMEIVFSSS